MSLTSGQLVMQSASYFIDSTMTTVGIKTIITATVRLPSGSTFNSADVLIITLPSDTTAAWDTSTAAACTSVNPLYFLIPCFISRQMALQ